MINLRKTLLVLLPLFLPSQLGIHFWPNFSFVNGIRVDYLSPTLYLTDIFTVILLFTDTSVVLKTIKTRAFIIVFLISILNILNSVSPLLSVYKWLKIFELVLLSIYFFKNRSIAKSVFIKILPISILWVSAISIFQVIKGGSLNGVFYFLGERSFTVNTPGIALSKIVTSVSLRPYGTLPHPNALAGFLLVSLIFLYFTKAKRHFIAFSVLPVIAILLSESFSAWLALAVLIFISFFTNKKPILKKTLVILLFILSIASPLLFSGSTADFFSKNTVERINLINVAGNIISKKPLFGVGVGAFITQIPTYLYGKVLLLQPVHNIPLLVFSEAGIVGAVGFYTLLLSVPISAPIVIVLVTSLFDHYWLTLQSPSLLLAIIIGLSYNTKSLKKLKDNKNA